MGYIAIAGMILMFLGLVNMIGCLFSSTLLDLEGADDTDRFAVSVVGFLAGLVMVLISAKEILL